jgi:hypothetical protein
MRDKEQANEFLLEGTKLLKEWSIWMVTVESGTIALIGSGYLKEGKLLPIWCQVLVVCFGISIAVAAHLLSGLPWIVLNLDKPGFENFHQAPITSGWPLKHVKIWHIAVRQHLFFGGGLLALILGILGLL